MYVNRQETINMPQPQCTSVFEACHVNRLIGFSQKPSPLLGCLLKIMYLCRIIQMPRRLRNEPILGMTES